MLSDEIKKIFEIANQKNATDIHICAHASILFRIGDDLIPMNETVLTSDVSKKLSYDLMNNDQIKTFEDDLDIDFMLAYHQNRYRINISFNDGNIGSVLRILIDNPQTIDELHLPPVIKKFTTLTKGLVLITGATSQGKTTTMAAVIHEINLHSRKHMVTIEDPIEYVHRNIKSVVRQREVGRDTKTFAQGLRAALRQNPDVISIGEMRDFETFKIALIAASTGILVLSTLHTISIDKVIERLVSYGSTDFEMHIRYLLADSVQAIIHQELIPTISGEKRVACEIMVATSATRHIFRKRGAYFLRNVMATGGREGMITMRQSITKLLEEKLITEDQTHAILLNYP